MQVRAKPPAENPLDGQGEQTATLPPLENKKVPAGQSSLTCGMFPVCSVNTAPELRKKDLNADTLALILGKPGEAQPAPDETRPRRIGCCPTYWIRGPPESPWL